MSWPLRATTTATTKLYLLDLGSVGLVEQKLMPRRGESQKVQNLLFTAFHIHELALKSNNNNNFI